MANTRFLDLRSKRCQCWSPGPHFLSGDATRAGVLPAGTDGVCPREGNPEMMDPGVYIGTAAQWPPSPPREGEKGLLSDVNTSPLGREGEGA